MNGLMVEWTDRQADRQIDRCIMNHEWMWSYEEADGQKDGWMDKCIDGWIDG